MVHVGVTARDAGTNFRTELNRGLRFAPDNGTEMRLVDADDAVGTSSTCFTISAPTTMRAGLLPAPLWLFLRRLLYSFSILSQGRWSASLTQRLDLLNPEVTPEVQTGRDCDIVSSISPQFLNVLTSKGSHFGRIDQILYNINS